MTTILPHYYYYYYYYYCHYHFYLMLRVANCMEQNPSGKADRSLNS